MDALPVVCSHCAAAEAVSLGRHDGMHLFECIACGRTFEIREYATPIDRFARQASAAGYQVAERAGAAVLVVDFERQRGDTYALQWAVMPTRCVRKLLDDQVHPVQALELDAVLDVIEAAEIADTRRTWPDAPQWHAVRLVRRAVEA